MLARIIHTIFLNGTRITQMTRIFADNIRYLLMMINKKRIREYPRYQCHLRSV